MTAAPVDAPVDELARLLAEHEDWLAVERGPRAPTRAPRTAATSGATPRSCATAARSIPRRSASRPSRTTCATSARSRPTTAGRCSRRRRSPAAWSRCARSTASARPRGCCPPTRARTSTRPACRRASPRRSTRRRSSSCSARSPATVRCRNATARCSRRCTRPASASARPSGSSSSDLDLQDGVVRVLGKGDKERIVPIGRSARRVVGAYLGDGRLTLRNARSRRAAEADAVFLNARGGRISRQACWSIVRTRGRPGGPRRAPVTPRAAPLVRHAHARPGRRPAGRPGAARAREHLDHAGVHEGLARAAAGRLRRRASPGGSSTGLSRGRFRPRGTIAPCQMWPRRDSARRSQPSASA